jgi:hypothetical protein
MGKQFFGASLSQIKRLNSGTFMQWNCGQGTVTGGTGIASLQVFFFMYDGSTLNGWHTSADVIDDNWHHYVAVRPASGNPQIYIDGVNMTIVQENGNVITNLTNTDPIRIGDANNGGASTTAQVALFRYYMKALNQAEVTALYKEVQGPMVRGVPLVNRSFEAPSVGTWAYAPAGNGWNMGGSCGITVGSTTWISGNPQEGSQCAWIQTDGTSAQAFSQSISTVPGRTYYFSLWGSARPTFGPQAFDLWLDGVAQGMWGAYYPQTAGTWNYFTGSFVATATSHTFGFCGHNVLGGDRSCLLDNIRLWYIG